MVSESWWAIRCVWLRYFDVFRKNLFYGLFTTYMEPLLYLLSFGFGLGAMVGPIHSDGNTVPYRAFILGGIVAQTLLFQSFFESAYGGFVRMYYQRIFQVMAITPVTLSEVLWGELLWDASKATFGASAVLLIGVVIGDFSPLGALASIPLCFLGGLIFAGLGLWVSAVSTTIEDIAYPQYLAVFPMFLFCGIFFPLSNLPHIAQIFAWCLPLTSLLSLLRWLLLGFPFALRAIPILLFWSTTLVLLSRRTMIRRLVK